jgi:hypothetical protein
VTPRRSSCTTSCSDLGVLGPTRASFATTSARRGSPHRPARPVRPHRGRLRHVGIVARSGPTMASRPRSSVAEVIPATSTADFAIVCAAAMKSRLPRGRFFALEVKSATGRVARAGCLPAHGPALRGGFQASCTPGCSRTPRGGTSVTALRITIGRSRRNPRGRPLDLPDDVSPARALATALESQPRANEAWWSPHTWRDNHRTSDRWEAACAVGVDVDYQDADGKHVAPRPEIASAARSRCARGQAARVVFHVTPRGFRTGVRLRRPSRTATSSRAQRAAPARSSPALRQGIGCRLRRRREGALDLARFLYAPARRSTGSSGTRTSWCCARSRTRRRRSPRRPQSRAWRRRSRSRMRRAGTTQSTPATGRGHSGTCPACGHKECFGRFPDNPTRWACFSSSTRRQASTARAAGTATRSTSTHAAGVQPAELLKREGYLGGATTR